MCESLRSLDEVLYRLSGVRLWAAALLCAALGAVGALAGVFFPKYEATALLQFPEARKVEKKPSTELQQSFDPKANVIELAAYKRVAASYDSVGQLATYFEAKGLASDPSANRLLRLAEDSGFWTSVASPILPFSRRDQKEFGDIKDASATTMLGLEMRVGARSEEMAERMLSFLAGYYINAIVRERVRAWVLAGKVDSQSQEKSVRADVVKAELDIEILGQRVKDMKSVLGRYPDAARMDSRQVVSVNPAEGGERYLSPLAQLVGAESAISERSEMIRRWTRDLKQKRLLATYFERAEAAIDRQLDVGKLLEELRRVASETFTQSDVAEEWNLEAALRINGALDNFEVMRSQFGVRNGMRMERVAGRTPLRLSILGVIAALAAIVGMAFLRATFAAVRGRS